MVMEVTMIVITEVTMVVISEVSMMDIVEVMVVLEMSLVNKWNQIDMLEAMVDEVHTMWWLP